MKKFTDEKDLEEIVKYNELVRYFGSSLRGAEELTDKLEDEDDD